MQAVLPGSFRRGGRLAYRLRGSGLGKKTPRGAEAVATPTCTQEVSAKRKDGERARLTVLLMAWIFQIRVHFAIGQGV